MQQKQPSSYESAAHLARAVFAWAPVRVLVAVSLVLLSSLTEALGITCLIPLLHLLGVGDEAGAPGQITAFVARATAAVGIELSLATVLGFMFGLAVLRSAVNWLRAMRVEALRLGFVDALRDRQFAAIAGASWPFLVRRRMVELNQVLVGETGRVGDAVMTLIEIAVAVTMTLAQLALAAFISPLVSLGALLAGGGLLIALRRLQRRSHSLGHERSRLNLALGTTVSEFMQALKLAKSANAEAHHHAGFSGAMANLRQHEIVNVRLSALVRTASELGAVTVLVAMLWFATRSAGLGVPELLVIAFVFVRVLPSLTTLQAAAQRLAYLLPAYVKVLAAEHDLLEAAEPRGSGRAESNEAPLKLRRELALRDVSFAYDRASAPPTLDGVDLTIPSGKLVAIAGHSGAGKTTLVDVLLGLIEPDQGAVYVDDERLTGEWLGRWRRSVGYVPQDPSLFHDTIASNLRWARPEATAGELWDALRLAAAADFVEALPNGLDTVVRDAGVRLSGGERQRIMLARALVRKPTLLLLDEATSQVDVGTESRIVDTLRSLRERTTIVAVAHRPTLMEAADRIILLDRGRVAAEGGWQELGPRLAGLWPGRGHEHPTAAKKVTQ